MFSGRGEAGSRLAGRLCRRLPVEVLRSAVILGLPRGGVPVAAAVARAVGAELDVLSVRKLRAPDQAELAVGALAEGGAVVWNAHVLASLGLSAGDLADDVVRERAELARQVERYRGGRPRVRLAGRAVVVVDDGLATGASARAAVRAVQAADASRVVLAVPVAAPEPAAELSGEADDVVSVITPADFRAVGAWYADFAQVPEATVVELLDASAARRSAPGRDGWNVAGLPAEIASVARDAGHEPRHGRG